MRKLNLDYRFDQSTYRGRYKAQIHEHAMGRRKRPPSKQSVLAELKAEAEAAEVAKASKNKTSTKKKAFAKKK